MASTQKASSSLSSLIRQGIDVTMPAEGIMHDKDDNRACALGAAQAVLDEDDWSRLQHRATRTTVAPKDIPVVPPSSVLADQLARGHHPSLHLVVTTLNDRSAMSRGEIAEWLSGLDVEPSITA